MNKKVDDDFKYINDNYCLQAICTEMKFKIIDLQNRIDKAVELLKESGCYDEKAKIFCDDVWDELPELLSILEGDYK